jgi:hypothetical protein
MAISSSVVAQSLKCRDRVSKTLLRISGTDAHSLHDPKSQVSRQNRVLPQMEGKVRDSLLCSPGTILVTPDGCEERSDALEHGDLDG